MTRSSGGNSAPTRPATGGTYVVGHVDFAITVVNEAEVECTLSVLIDSPLTRGAPRSGSDYGGQQVVANERP